MIAAQTFTQELRHTRAVRKARKRISKDLRRYNMDVSRLGDGHFPRFTGSGAAQVPHLPHSGHVDALNSGIEAAWGRLSASKAYLHIPKRLLPLVLRMPPP